MIFLDRNITTKEHQKWWKNRKINWETAYLDTWNHPHRRVILHMLNEIEWRSLIEIGVGAGANLKAIIKNLQGKQLGGIDISDGAIVSCKKTFPNGIFFVSKADDILMSDKSTDVTLVDMVYIYVQPRHIKKHLKELIRITRNYVVICEFHHKNPIKRFIFLLKSGLHIHNWDKLLKKSGFYDIISMKLTKDDWPESKKHEDYCSVFLAKVPKK
jgi:ubiquinone/menaquinone biosynthesis C-methylase UbiE